jgi:hypothetical protein
MITQRRQDELKIIAQAWFDRLMQKYMDYYYERGMNTNAAPEEGEYGEGTQGNGLEGTAGEVPEPA